MIAVPRDSLAGFMIGAVQRAYELGIQRGFVDTDDYFTITTEEARRLLTILQREWIPQEGYYEYRDFLARLEAWVGQHQSTTVR
jgi:hypothetical protein